MAELTREDISERLVAAMLTWADEQHLTGADLIPLVEAVKSAMQIADSVPNLADRLQDLERRLAFVEGLAKVREVRVPAGALSLG